MPEETPQKVEPNPDALKLVIAGSYPQFTLWCRNHELNPNDRNVRCVGSIEALLGIDHQRLIEFWYVGQHWLWGGSSNHRARAELYDRVNFMCKLNPENKQYEEIRL